MVYTSSIIPSNTSSSPFCALAMESTFSESQSGAFMLEKCSSSQPVNANIPKAMEQQTDAIFLKCLIVLNVK